MSHLIKTTLCILVAILLLAACGTVQPSVEVSMQEESSISEESIEQTSTPPASLTATETSEPEPTQDLPTATQSPELTDIPEAEKPGEFQQATTLGEMRVDQYEPVYLYAPGDGSVWLISSQAVLRWDGQAWEEIVAGYEQILAFVDDLGRFWMLLPETGEITSWQEGEWITYGEDLGWKSVDYATEVTWWVPAPWRATTGAENNIWLPTAWDVRTFDGQRWSIHSMEDMGFLAPEYEELSPVHRLALLKGGTEAWVSECYYSGPGPMGGQGVRVFTGAGWNRVEESLSTGCISAMVVDADGNLWLGSAKILWKYEQASTTWMQYDLPEEILMDYRFTHPLQLVIDQSGDAWMIQQLCGGASCDGPANLVRFHEGEWSVVLNSQNWYSPLKQLALDGNGRAWAFWEGMVYQLVGDTLQAASPLDALGVDVSPDGKVWVLANAADDQVLLELEP